MIASLRTAAQGLLTLPKPNLFYRDNGHYASIFGQPSKRLKQILTIDREILILLSCYAEQQQRTIKTASGLIKESGGRLERTVAIVVHEDPDGNLKLKKWGRDLGITILPIFANTCPSTPEEFERLLSTELFSHDPFDITGPVSDDEHFFGRRTEAQDLARKLQSSQIRSCLGIRKIGKTSILNRIIGEVRAHHDSLSVVLDGSKDEIWSMNAGQLMASLATAILAVADRQDRYISVTGTLQPCNIADATNLFLEAVKKTEHPVIIFMDEVDYLTPGSPTAAHWRSDFNHFWRNFRAAYQELHRLNKQLSVLVSGISSKWFFVESIEGVENAALALIPEEYLSPLARTASNAMIKKIARSAGLVFSEECASIVSAACSDMPFWVRKTCSHINKNIDIGRRPYELKPAELRAMLNTFMGTDGATIAQFALRHLFKVYPELEQPCLAYLDKHSSTVGKSDTSLLQKYGILSVGSNPGISGAMMEEGLRLYVEEKVKKEYKAVSGDTESTAENGLNEWAENLAVLNKGRNLVERQLRQIVLNFLRLDCMKNKSKPDLKRRLLGGMTLDQQRKLKALSAGELMDQFYWKNLAELIVQEWALFDGIFSDKKQFLACAFLVNRRYDAHAKDCSPDEYSSYRRALKWISDRISV